MAQQHPRLRPTLPRKYTFSCSSTTSHHPQLGARESGVVDISCIVARFQNISVAKEDTKVGGMCVCVDGGRKRGLARSLAVVEDWRAQLRPAGATTSGHKFNTTLGAYL